VERERSMLDQLLLIIFGFFIGIIASMTGIGGGIFIVPILTFFYDFRVNAATGTSLATIIFTALASSISYARQKRIYYRTGLVLALTTAPGAFVGSWVAGIAQDQVLGLTFGVFLVLVALRMIIGLLKRKSETQAQTTRTDMEVLKTGKMAIIGVALGFFGGFASGLLGIGGGILVVPIMTIALGMPIHVAVATSMFTIIFTATSGVTEYYLLGLVSFPTALLFALGTVVGAQVGAYTSGKVSSRNLTMIFCAILIVAGANMILKYM
jgi:uncharacterized membrane protein YfcA